MSPRPSMNRRAFLRGAGGVAVALPFLQSLQTTARADTPAPPKRFINWLGWWGTLPQFWMGPGEGVDLELGHITAPLEPLKSKMSVVSGVNMASAFRQWGRAGSHLQGGASMLTSAPSYQEGEGNGTWHYSTGPSIDFVIANRIQASLKHKMLFVGSGSDHLHSVCVDEDLNAKADYRYGDPSQLYDVLFAEFLGDAGARERLRAGRRSLLDAVMPEYASLANKVSGDDKQVIDRHLASLREIEVSVNAIAECAPPEHPGGGWDQQDPAQAKARYRLLFDMVAVAMACDLTRLATLSLSAYLASPRDVVPDFDALHPEDPEADCHGFSHAKWTVPGQTDVWREIQVWRMEVLRDFALKLDSISEGEGTTVLDNSVIVHTSELLTGTHDIFPLQNWGYSDPAENPPARMTGLPMFYIGGCGGALKTGQHFRLDQTHTYADGLGKYSHGELYLTMARAMDIDAAALPSFGDPEVCNSVVEEILV